MKTNEGKLDRIFRITLGLGLLGITQLGPQTPWGYIGFIPLFTGIFGYCPLYQVVGLSTCPLKK